MLAKGNVVLRCPASVPLAPSLHGAIPRSSPAAAISLVGVQPRHVSRVPGQKTSRAVIFCQASNDGASGSHKGHAFLHDFCMVIPYGAITLGAGGLLAFLLGASSRSVGGIIAAAGAAACVLAALSLKAWKAGTSCTPYTLLSSGVATGVAWLSWQQVQRGAPAVWATGSLAALSVALALFCLYNVVAGGNPPPSARPKAGTA